MVIRVIERSFGNSVFQCLMLLTLLPLTAEAVDPVPVSILPFPSTVPDLISNLRYAVDHDLTLHDDFYSDENLRRLMNAKHVEGERTAGDVALTAELFGPPKPIAKDSKIIMGIAAVLIRRNAHGDISINLQINDPAARPAYDAVEQILGPDWKPMPPPIPNPHRIDIPPTGPHGNAHMTLRTRTSLEDVVMEATFDPDGKLHNFSVFINPIEGSNWW